MLGRGDPEFRAICFGEKGSWEVDGGPGTELDSRVPCGGFRVYVHTCALQIIGRVLHTLFTVLILHTYIEKGKY